MRVYELDVDDFETFAQNYRIFYEMLCINISDFNIDSFSITLNIFWCDILKEK